MKTIRPTREQMEAFGTDPYDGPIIMINLLKFRDKAAYAEGDPEYDDDLSGREAYMRYGKALAEFASGPEIGLEVLYSGSVARFFIGEGDWDQVAVVRYPSRKHFQAMNADPRYRAAHRHRAAGLAHQDLIETRPEGA